MGIEYICDKCGQHQSQFRLFEVTRDIWKKYVCPECEPDYKDALLKAHCEFFGEKFLSHRELLKRVEQRKKEANELDSTIGIGYKQHPVEDNKK